EEHQERHRLEHLGEEVVEARAFLQGQRPEHVRRLTHPEGVYMRLVSDASPGSMERSVEPEAGLVSEHDDAAAGRGFFLIAGSVSRSQVACASTSARASRLRGRWMEKPS